jgi:hypothetical protein
MRTLFSWPSWRLAAMGAALFALVGVPALWTTAWASDAGKALAFQSDQSDEETEKPYLEERVAELETQVAELQTAVAELQEGDDGGQADVVEPTPTEIAAVTVAACGRPFASWGTATSDNVSVHLIQVIDGDAAEFEVEGAQVYAMEVGLLNSRNDALDVDPEDWVVTDCDGTEYTALDFSEGVEPSLAQGSLGPGEEGQGWVTFALPPGAQAATFDYRMQSPGRSGAQVSCPLVDTSADPGTLSDASGGAGCSARGGSG